jgi:hypothetical protein
MGLDAPHRQLLSQQGRIRPYRHEALLLLVALHRHMHRHVYGLANGLVNLHCRNLQGALARSAVAVLG